MDDAQSPHLKVSDRRHFTAEGDRRSDVPEVARIEPQAEVIAAPAAKPEAAPAPPPAPSAAAPPPRERLAARQVELGGLLEGLYTTAMLQLGAVARPGQPPEPDIEGARETIDLLGVLEEKTHGNLTAQESALLSELLYELRMTYLQATQPIARKAPGRP